jgi:uncharacterized protein (TIGR03437 family)
LSSNQSATLTASFNGSSITIKLNGNRIRSQAVVSANGDIGTFPPSLNPLSSLYCSPKNVAAGTQTTCELKVVPNTKPAQFAISSSSEHAKVPQIVVSRLGQSSLTFQVLIQPVARQGTAKISAKYGDREVNDLIEITSANGPVLNVPAKRIARIGEPVNVSVQAEDPAGLPVQVSADNLPAGASFDGADGLFSWVPGGSQAGGYEITFRATNSAMLSSTSRLTINVGTGAPVLEQNQRLSCSPNSIATLFGKWLASGGESSDPSGRALDLGGTKININGQYMPVLFSSNTRVEFLCPSFVAGTSLSVMVENDSGNSAALAGLMQNVSPRILSIEDLGTNQGLITFADTGELAMFRNYRVAARPAQPGDELLLWATGFGSDADRLLETVSVRIGDGEAGVRSIEQVLGSPGLYIVRVSVPQTVSTGDAVPVSLDVSTPASAALSNIVFASFEPAIRQ